MRRRRARRSGNGPQRVQGGERGRVAVVKQSGDARALVIAQAGDQMAPRPGPRAVTDSANQSLDNRDARQKHLIGDEPGRGSINQGAGPIVTAPAQSVEPSGQPATRHGVVAEVRKSAVRPDKREAPDAPAFLKIAIHAARDGSMASCSITIAKTDAGISAGETGNAPRNLALVSMTAKPSRLWPPRRVPMRSRSVWSRWKYRASWSADGSPSKRAKP